MSGKVMKRERREGLRRTKRHPFIPVDDGTNYVFDKTFYWERRNHKVTAPLGTLGYAVVGYVTAKKGSAEVHNPNDMFATEAAATVKLPRLNRKEHEIRLVIHKPLSGMRRAPKVYETVEDENRNPIRIPRT